MISQRNRIPKDISASALSLQRRPEGERAGIEFGYDKRGFISPDNLWEDKRVELIARVL